MAKYPAPMAVIASLGLASASVVSGTVYLVRTYNVADYQFQMQIGRQKTAEGYFEALTGSEYEEAGKRFRRELSTSEKALAVQFFLWLGAACAYVFVLYWAAVGGPS